MVAAKALLALMVFVRISLVSMSDLGGSRGRPL